MRGGVSAASAASISLTESSPRAWGCFSRRDYRTYRVIVFPTCVGVFPKFCTTMHQASGLPHVRGGVSKGIKNDYYQKSSSLRAWECFRTSGALRGPLKGENHVYDH